mgnify:CR=1 FL=1
MKISGGNNNSKFSRIPCIIGKKKKKIKFKKKKSHLHADTCLCKHGITCAHMHTHIASGMKTESKIQGPTDSILKHLLQVRQVFEPPDIIRNCTSE